jgi:hypoxanthine-DNA glycosylase
MFSMFIQFLDVLSVKAARMIVKSAPSATPQRRTAAAAPQPAMQRGLAPQAGPATRLLLLGSFPGQASLAAQQYYAHPRNQFWTLLSALWGEDLGALSYARRIARMKAHGLGLWDVHASCRRQGSLDSAIRDAEANDLAALVARLGQLRAIAHHGGESARAMRVTAALGLPVYRLPSSSPANASWSFERKLAAWREVFAAAGLAPEPT